MKKALITILCFVLYSCYEKEKYNVGVLPTSPVNLSDINSTYDDYNSTAPWLGETFPLCFSSNRNSSGSNFDFIYKLMSIRFSKGSGVLEVFNETNGNLDVVAKNRILNTALSRTNTKADELGPYLIPTDSRLDESQSSRSNLFFLLYANNRSGNLDIFFTQNISDPYFTEPAQVHFLNSPYDDAYPTFNKDNSEIYFSSNRQGGFDIFSTNINKESTLETVLTDTLKHEIFREEQLSSSFDDMCPFIWGNMLVFASNRAGGFGGYDLFYSVLENGSWSEPINFGEGINSKFDEFRPIIRPQVEFSSDFMLFSSNRPGGKGGFDLYYVGVEKH